MSLASGHALSDAWHQEIELPECLMILGIVHPLEQAIEKLRCLAIALRQAVLLDRMQDLDTEDDQPIKRMIAPMNMVIDALADAFAFAFDEAVVLLKAERQAAFRMLDCSNDNADNFLAISLCGHRPSFLRFIELFLK